MGVAAGKGSARAEIAGVGAVVQIGRAVLDLVLPTLCAACGRATHGAREPLCTACAADLALQVGGDWCRVCGSDVGPHLLEEGRCGECRRARPKIERLVRVGRHDGALRSWCWG
ncbi:MAG: double zinc ribbon domain-containing protein [Phycisphaerae bacterium]